MIKFKNLTIKNFMSFGNVPQDIDLTSPQVTLILGENRDVTNNGSYTESRNGTGKSSIINAMVYALTGKPLGNIRQDNLINSINDKNMVVTMTFEKDGIDYKIVRGRKPNILKFFINGAEDNAQGEMSKTQEDIQAVIGMSQELLSLVVFMTTQNEGFLSYKNNVQRQIIEELFGIGIITDKANNLKTEIDITKKRIDNENVRIDTIRAMNDKTTQQISRLQNNSSNWEKDHEKNLNDLIESIESLNVLDINEEKLKHQYKKDKAQIKLDSKDVNTKLVSFSKELDRLRQEIVSHDKKIKSLSNNTCYACHQHVQDNTMLEKLQNDRAETEALISKQEGFVEELLLEKSKYDSKISKIPDLGPSFYEDERDAWEHDSNIKNLTDMLEKEIESKNPYTEQIDALKKESLQVIDNTELNDLKTLLQHQEFLLRILINKDSFIRKKINNQYIPYLNMRLDYYLKEIGLPHLIKFLPSLDVEIDHMGRFIDFDNLSRGQKNRLIIASNMAFRDLFETIHTPINCLFVDELIDSGMDQMGVELSVHILKEFTRNNGKSVYLVSHREEVKPRVNHIMNVIFENGFSRVE